MAELVHILANLLSSSVSVEIVPGGLEQWESLQSLTGPTPPSAAFPFLYVEGHLGVPQKILYQLYLSALGLFNPKTLPSAASQIAATSVILLANPAHRTALNLRKRLLQTGDLSAQSELFFSAVLLSSSRPSAKESILWDHRRWIFARLYPRTTPEKSPSLLYKGWARDYSAPELPAAAIVDEFRLISRCCEIYPRNYYAWTHHHFVIESLHVSLGQSGTVDSPYLQILVEEFLNLQRWIESHVSDHSAIHQLCSIVSRLQNLDNSTLARLADPLILFQHALSLVTSFPSHESLWMYLRAMITLSTPDARTRAATAISSTAALDGRLRDRFISWIERSGIPNDPQI
ncbi:hypothetical protein C8J57DRAFT_1283310 [Mycena rebaudengoi]|nr:hypothetical protein C8J57DRAFT_1283310 [Mycena rebaudengoi]